MSQKHHICVCICTYKRPKQLDRLLWKLEKQETGGIFDYSIVIVDNDRSESARLTVESHAGQSNIAISYHVEPQQNIALARNRTIENANGDFLGFIDDDEWPDSRWLFNLFGAINRYKSDGILGPVLPCFEKEPPQWVLKGRFFDRPAHPTGHVLEWKNTRTGNALLRRDIFKDDREWFHPRFGRGGEDRDFFRRKIGEGHVFVWCDEAPVFETVPPERWGQKVLMKRALLRGKMALLSSESGPQSILISVGAVAIYSVCLPLLFVLSPIIGYDVFMKYLIKNCDHLGKILAFLKIDLVRTKYVSL
ncbi:MAG: glycosyltransferase [Candidatus Aminicenantales bacterium]